MSKRLAAVVLAAGLGACASFPENAPRRLGVGDGGYRWNVVDAATDAARNDPKTLVLLAFSGGGSRASAMAYGVLEQLRRTCVTIDGERRRLLDEIDVISSNSGGSYTAAYYGLFREQTFKNEVDAGVDCRVSDDANPGVDPAAPSFQKAFLDADFEREVVLSLLDPVNLWRVLSLWYNRSDLAAEVLDDMLFQGRTFADLEALGKPFVIINAHDVVHGNRFHFTQEYFDYICSDLDDFPVARAVIASSAVHGLFGAVRLINYPKDNCPEPAWVAPAIRNLEFNPASYAQARTVRIYREKECWRLPPDECAELADERHYVRLNDGGTVDNLGVRSLISGLEASGHDLNLLGDIATGEVERVLLISVNAASDPDTELPLRSRDVRPSRLINAAVGGSIDTVTLDSMDQLWDLVIRRQQDAVEDAVYHDPVLISFEHLDDRVQARCLKNIDTRLRLHRDEIDAVRMAGARLLTRSLAFQDFLDVYDGVSYEGPDLLDGRTYCDAVRSAE